MNPKTLFIKKFKFKKIRQYVSIIILVAFISTSVKSPAYAQLAVDPMPRMPAPGVMVHLSPEFTPAILKGIVIHPENALKFDFIIYKGDRPLNEDQKKQEYTKLIKYFMASLAVPDDNQWVNLSPYEKDRIIKDDFGKTEMGRDLLAQDYMLKQITASLIYPQNKLGQKFWDTVYAKAQQQFGTTNIPVNTFNKVWIVPDDALVYEKGNTAYVVKNHLKVMLEEDYLSLAKHSGIQSTAANKTHTIASQVVRQIVLPALEKEVNEGKNFAPLRQVFSGVVLAAWYKRELKESLLGKIYMDKSRLKGVDQNPKNNELIYRQYLKAFKKGVFNFIQEDVDKYTNETIPRKYFSGGTAIDYDEAMSGVTSDGLPALKITKELDPAQSVDATAVVQDSDLVAVAATEVNQAMVSLDRERRVASLANSIKIRLVNDVELPQEITLLNQELGELIKVNSRFVSGNLNDKLGQLEEALKVVYFGLSTNDAKAVKNAKEQAQRIDFVQAAKGQDAAMISHRTVEMPPKVEALFRNLEASSRVSDQRVNRIGGGFLSNFLFNRGKDRLGGTNPEWGTKIDNFSPDELKLLTPLLGLPQNSQVESSAEETRIDNLTLRERLALKSPFFPRMSYWQLIVDWAKDKYGITISAAVIGNSNTRKAPGDKAMYGGIDFNSVNLNLRIKRDGNGVPLPISQQNLANIHIDGLIPVITDIEPAAASPLLSQLQLSGTPQPQAKV